MRIASFRQALTPKATTLAATTRWVPKLRAMTLALVWLATLTGLAACDDSGAVSPSDATDGDLYGWWRNVDPASNQVRLFGFLPPAEALDTVAIFPDEATDDVTAFFQGLAGETFPTLVQLAHYDMEDGLLVQTILADLQAAPGTQYGTELLSITPGESMTLASPSAASGRRDYTWHRRCPSEDALGWRGYLGLLCNTYFADGASLAVDRRGAVHHITGVANNQSNGLCSPQPTYGVLTTGCEPKYYGHPNTSRSAIVIDDTTDTVHVVYTLSAANGAKTGTLHHRWRGLDDDVWQEEDLDPAPRNVAYLALDLAPPGSGRELLVTVQETNGRLERFVREGGSWTAGPPTDAEGAELHGALLGQAVDPDGRMVLALTNAPDVLVREGAGGAFAPVPVPEAADLQGYGAEVDAAGRIHVLMLTETPGDGSSARQTHYAVFDGADWTLVPLGSVGALALLPPDGDTWRLFHQVPSWAGQPEPRFAFTELTAAGVTRSRSVTVDDDSGANATLGDSFGMWAAAAGPEGTVAVTWSGQAVRTLGGQGALPAETGALTVTISGDGAGRVRSDDGAIDCPGTCTATYPLGTRVALRLEPEAGSLAPLGFGEPGFDGETRVTVGEAEVALDVPFTVSDFQAVVPVGDATGSTGVTGFDADATRFGATVLHSQPELDVAGVVITPTKAANVTPEPPFAYAALWVGQDGTGAAATWLPGEPVAFRLAPAGGAWAVVRVGAAFTVAGVDVDATDGTDLVRLELDASSAIVGADVVLTLPAAVTLLGAELSPLGGVGLAIGTSGSSVDVLGLTSRSGLVVVDPPGGAGTAAFPFASGDALAANSVHLDAADGADGLRVAATVGDELVVVSGGSAVVDADSGLMASEGDALDVAVGGDSVWRLTRAKAGGELRWQEVSIEGALLGSGTASNGLGLQADLATIAADASGAVLFQRMQSGMTVHVLTDPTQGYSAGSTFAHQGAIPGTPRLASDGSGRLFQSVFQFGTVDYLIREVPGQRWVLVEQARP